MVPPLLLNLIFSSVLVIIITYLGKALFLIILVGVEQLTIKLFFFINIVLNFIII